jgi:hypothetical protein
MNGLFAVLLAFGAILWPVALLLGLGWRDEANPGGWCGRVFDALEHGLFGGRP